MVSKEPDLRASLIETENIYRQCLENINTLLDSKKVDLEFGNKVLNVLGDIEDDADDNSTLIVDFADLRNV